MKCRLTGRIWDVIEDASKENEHATLGRATIDTKTIPNPGPPS